MFAFVCSMLIAAGCTTTTDSPSGETGSLNLDLVVGDDIVINEVAWTISSPGMEDMAGTINTSAPGATASVEVFGLPPGDDYLVELEATDESGEITCRGDAPFSVEVGVATDIMVMLNCKKPPTLGGVRVNGKFNICAELEKAIVSPLQTSVGNEIDLSALTSDAEGDAVTIVWSASGGEIADANANDTTYTCGEVGEQSITISVSDDEFVYCMDEWTVPVTCVEGDANLCDGVECDDTGNECTAAECDPADGQCKEEALDDGTECNGGAGQCMGGECVDNDLCEGVDCDDQNECTDDVCNPETGQCDYTPVDDGTECDGGAGMCVSGECMTAELCEGVECEDTGNECTTSTCNNQTGECDEMNVADGTECNGGSGACSNGDCIDNNLCEGVDCSSDNDCVGDGACDPASGQCIPGDNLPADTNCSGGVCDGNGACVECNDASQCPAGDQCNSASCDGNACGTTPVMDGTVCDFQGTEDGICEGGQCVEAPQCISPGDCDDGNACTLESCDGGTCVYEPLNGGSCDADGVPGTCDNGACVGLCEGVDCTSNNQCVQDGECDEQSGSCIPGANEPEGTPCDQDGGTECNGAGECISAVTACNDGATQTNTVQIGCSNGVTDAQSPFPNELSITVAEAVVSNQPFDVDASGIGAFPKFFLDAAQSTVPGGVRSAIVEGFNVTVEANNGSGQILLQADPDGIDPGLVSFCQYPKSTQCTQDSDCIVPPCNDPVLLAGVPLSEDCGAGGVCEGLGQGFADGASAQCNITAAPEFCVTDDLLVPLFAPGGVQSMTAGASGEVRFNWAVDPVTVTCPDANSRCASSGGSIPNGALILPASIYGDPVGDPGSIGLNGIRLNVAGALFVALQCSAGQDGGSCSATATQGCLFDSDCPGGETCVGIGVDDDIIMPTDPNTLPACPIN
jgi:hypothetical protein